MLLNVLLILLMLLAVFAYEVNGKNLLNPACVVCAVFIVSTVLAIIGNKNWKYSMHIESVMIIFGALSLFSIASSCGTHISNMITAPQKFEKILWIPTKGFVYIVTIILLCFTVFTVRDFVRNASLVRATVAGFGGMIKASRDAATLGLASSSVFSSLSVYFGRAASYIGIYLFIVITYSKNQKAKEARYLLLPCVPYIVTMLLSTGRTLLIWFVTYIITIYGIVILRSAGAAQRILAKKFFKIMVVFVIVFIGYGNMRQGANGGLLSALNGITSYGGFSIPSFDHFIESGVRNTGGFGSHTLLQIYELLKRVGVAIPDSNGSYDAILINGYRGNIFTALRRYVEDYGVPGCLIIMIFLGFFSSLAYNNIFKHANNHVAIIYYSLTVEFLYEFSIEERFMCGRLGMPSILDLIAILIVWNIYTSVDFSIGDRYHSLKFLNSENRSD